MAQLYVLPPGEADPDATIAAVRAARGDPARVVLEGAHALKHAVRFGAVIELVASPDPRSLERLLAELAPDVSVPVPVEALTPSAWRRLVPRELPSPAIAVARRPPSHADRVLAADGRVVALEQPRHLGNLGAVVRVAAAAGAGGVLVLGGADPWHPTAVRAAAGLQFALPVARTHTLPPVPRPLVALDAGGRELVPGGLATDAVVLVGSERHGLTRELRDRADERLAIPMRAGVSSLNVATAVAAALYRG